MANHTQASPVSMKLRELKQKVYEAWEFLSSYSGCVVLSEHFKPEVRREFGDLRYKETWVKALTWYEALNVLHDCLDAHYLVLHTFNFTEERWDYEFRYRIFDEFLMIPNALDLVKLGLEQLVSNSFTDRDRKQAYGFPELVAEQQGRSRFAAELTGQIPATYSA